MFLLNSPFSWSNFVHPQRTYNWELIMPQTFGIIPGIAVSKFCQSVRFGQYDIQDIIEMKAGPFKDFYAGLMNVQTVTASFVSPVPDIVSSYFTSWKNKIVDKDGYYQVSSEYKKRIYIIMYDRTGIPSNKATLINAFPIRFPAYNLDYNSEDVVRVDVEFRVDRVLFGVGDISLSNLGETARELVGSILGR